MPDNIDIITADTTGKLRPALSATQDLPRFINGAPPEGDAVVSRETPAASDNQVDLTKKPAADAAPEGEAELEIETDEQVDEVVKKDTTPPWMKAVVTKQRNKARAESERAKVSDEKAAAAETARLAAEAKATKLENDLVEARKVPVKAPEFAEPRPKRDTFETPDAYDTALETWAARKATFDTEQKIAGEAAKAESDAKAAKATADKEAADKATKEEQERLQKSFGETRAKAIEKYPDFAEVAESETVKISTVMAAALINAGEVGRDIQYFLGKNPKEAERIAAIPFAPQQVFELGRIAAQLAAAPKRVMTTAPDPITPVTSRNGATEKTPDEMTMEEYAATRTKKILAERRGGSPLGTRPH